MVPARPCSRAPFECVQAVAGIALLPTDSCYLGTDVRPLRFGTCTAKGGFAYLCSADRRVFMRPSPSCRPSNLHAAWTVPGTKARLESQGRFPLCPLSSDGWLRLLVAAGGGPR